jgi:hypothetical protein
LFKKGFAMVFHLWIHGSLVRLTSSITFPYPSLPFPITQQLLVCFIMPSFYTDAMYFYMIHYHSLFFFLLPPVPLNSPAKTNMIHTHTHTHTNHVCICVYIYLLDLSYVYKRKHAMIVFLNLAYFL